MGAYRLSEDADADLSGIFVYSVTTFGEAIAQDYFLGLHDALELIADNPMIGAGADYVRPGLRRFAHRRHVVFYRVLPTGVRVLRILHGTQDPLKHLSED